MTAARRTVALLDDLEAIRADTFQAAQLILDAVDSLDAQVDALPAAQSDIQGRLREAIGVIAGGCAFQDLVGQRLSRIARELNGLAQADGDPLLNGPASMGEGLSQAEADALLEALLRGDPK